MYTGNAISDGFKPIHESANEMYFMTKKTNNGTQVTIKEKKFKSRFMIIVILLFYQIKKRSLSKPLNYTGIKT